MTEQDDNVRHNEALEATGRWRRRTGLIVLSELGLVAGSVAIFFVFLTALVRFYFPVGSALSADGADVSHDPAASSDVTLEVSSESTFVERLFAGEILGIQRRVQRRGADSLIWSAANVGDTLAENDAVQTFARSTAHLKVDDRSRITIGQNSLIVFDRGDADPFVSNPGSVLVMIDGELSGKLTSEDDSALQFGVKLPNSDVTLVRSSDDPDVEFLITVNDDQSTTVNLHGGSATIVGRDGERVTLNENESVTIDSEGTGITLSKLPPAPHNTGPSDLESVTYRDVPETVVFRWDPVTDADRYHVVIARDPEFADRVVDDDVIGNSFAHGALGPGTYYWYVRSRVAWSQSQRSAVRRLQVVQDDVPPQLELDSPPPTVAAGEWRLSGRTDPGARVFVDDAQVEHDGGRIDHPVDLVPGANIIVVKAMDAAGNLNYASISVNAK